MFNYYTFIIILFIKCQGLLQAVTKLLPYVEHRQCARYIYANFRKKYIGLELKNLFWEAAKSIVEGDFTCHEKLEQEDFETFKDLQAFGYDHGDIAEAFNKVYCYKFSY